MLSRQAPVQMSTGLTVLLLISLQPGIDSLRILGIFPLNSHSHWAMCGRLVKGLADRGHDLDVYSHYPLKNPPPNYRDHSLAGTLPAFSNNMSYDMAIQFQASVSISTMKKSLEHVGTPICALMELPIFRDLREKTFKGEPYDLVIVEVFMANCYLAWGRHLDVPMVGVMTRPLLDWFDDDLGNPLNTAITPGMSVSYHHPMNFWQRLVNTVNTKIFSVIVRYLMSEQDADVERIFGPGYPTVSELQKDLDLVFVNSHLSLEGSVAYTPAIVPIAGIHIADKDVKLPEDVQKWLDDSTVGCIYFSLGSMIMTETFPKPVLKSIYDSFKTIAPVRVLWKIAKPELLPSGLPSNVLTQKWFPQNQVLKHENTKVFVTHGGLMSLQEAIHFGVPMVGIPIFGDQHQNVETNVKRGISIMVQLSELTEDTFTKAITEIIQNPMYRKNSEKLKSVFVDRPMSPLDTAIFWVEYIGRHGKKALRSPLVDMSWYQKNLIDVYGVILLTLYAVYYILKSLVLVRYNKKDCKHNITEAKTSEKKKN